MSAERMTREERAARRCDWCGEPIGITPRVGARFCSGHHKALWHNAERKRKATEAVARSADVDPPTLQSAHKRIDRASGPENAPTRRSGTRSKRHDEGDRRDRPLITREQSRWILEVAPDRDLRRRIADGIEATDRRLAKWAAQR